MARRSAPTGGRRTSSQRLLLGLNALLVVACLAAAAGFSKVRTTLQSVPVVDIGSAQAPEAVSTEPRNFLIIGTDSASRLDESDPVTKGRAQLGRLADVIMVLRVDPSEGTAQLLSIPRDTRVEVAPGGRMDRINSAIAGSNGARNLVQTVKRNFGISVDNYVQVDFLAFKQLVEVLGGVPEYFTLPVRDRNTGLRVTEAGCILLDRDQALAYARARHLEYYEDGRWKTDGTGDLGRITRQQEFVKRALRRAVDRGIRNPGTAVGLVDAATKAVVLDSTLDVGTILELVAQFRNFNPDTLQTEQVPTRAAPRGGIAYQEVVWDETRPLLLPFQGVVPGRTPRPADVIVDVRGAEAAAADAARRLDAAEFDAEAFETRSTASASKVVYGPDGRDAALVLAAQLETLPAFELDESVVGNRVVLTVGEDFGGVRETALSLDQLPPDLLPPTTTTTTTVPEVVPSTTTVPGGDGATTTVPADPARPGVLPTDPARAASCR